MNKEFDNLVIHSGRLLDFGFVNDRLNRSAAVLKVYRENPRILFALSEWVRRCYVDFDAYAGPHDIAKFASKSDAINLTGLASFSRNGFVREKALKNLSEFETPQILPFIILRLQDWVPKIAQNAQVAFVKIGPKASLEDWNYISPIVKRLEKRSLGEGIRQLVTGEVKRNFRPDERITKIKSACPEFREILWQTLFEEEEFARLASEFLKYETTPLIAQSVFHAAFKSDESSRVVSAAFLHPLQSIRQSALRTLVSENHPDLRRCVIDSLSDRSAGVRDFARYLARTELDIDSHQHFHGSARPEDAKLGYVLGWLETAKSQDAERVLQVFESDSRAKVRGAALLAYARLVGHSETSPDLLVRALRSDGYSRRSALKLIKMGWAGPISGELWALADAETNIIRKKQLIKLAADSNRLLSLIPLLKLMSYHDVEVKSLAVKLIYYWNQLPIKSSLADEERKKAILLFSGLSPKDQGRLWFLRI